MGLVAYDSSDEDEDVQVDTPTVPQNTKNDTSSHPSQNDAVTTSSSTATNGHNETTLSQPSAPKPPAPSNQPPPPQQQQPQPAPSSSTPLGPVLGPALGPSMPPPTGAASSNTLLPDPDSDVDMSFLDDPSTSSTNLPSGPSAAEPPKSPYTTTRTLLRDLTLPALPNMDIPASPPLSPSDISSAERLAALTSKFDKFLELKRTKGQHFNSRIAQSAATKNPGLMDKLMRFVGVETEFYFDDLLEKNVENENMNEGTGTGATEVPPPTGAEQYATTLSKEVWDPTAMPGWAYRDRLRKTQERMQKESERKRGERVEFVSGGSTSGMASRTGSATPLGSVAYPGGMSGGTGTSTGTGTPSASAGAGAGAGGGTTAGVKRKSRFDT